MQFASEYVLVKEEALRKRGSPAAVVEDKKQDKEELDEFEEDELREGIRSHSIKSVSSSHPTAETRSATNPTKTHKFRRVDTNVFRVDLSTLSQEAFTATGDPIICTACNAVFSSISSLEGSNPVLAQQLGVPTIHIEAPDGEKEDKGKEKEKEKGAEKEETDKVSRHQSWTCEFCGTENEVHIESEEMPQNDTMDFLLEVPESKSTSSEEENNVIFCVDTSGSMGVTTEVQGRLQLKIGAEKLAALQALNTEGGVQYMPGQSRNVTYISRMQCVQAAVGAQLDVLARNHPNKRVGLVSFSNDVLITGDGNQEAKVVAGDRLNDYDAVIASASECDLQHSIDETKDALSAKLNQLEENGATALGPALLVSVCMAAKKPGSKVILCTDGLANIGLGSMESEQEMEVAQTFYRKVAEFAKDRGVVINVISIKGTTCSMEILGLVADITSGEVDIVDPLLLTTNFHSILSIPVLAVNVHATILLHKGLFLRDEEDQIHEGRLDKTIGSVTKESSLTLEYGCKQDFQLDDTITSLPFQVQIHYTKLDGTKMVRVVSKAKPITTKREEAEQRMDRKVLGVNSMKKSARYARKGDYESARLYSYSTTRLMSRNMTDKQSRSDYTSFVNAYETLDSELLEAKKEEEQGQGGGALNSANNYGYLASAPATEEGSEALKTKRIATRAKCKDSTSSKLYKLSSVGYSVFTDEGNDAVEAPAPADVPSNTSDVAAQPEEEH